MTEKVILFQGGPACCGSFSDWCANTKWIITDTYIEKQTGMCCQSIDTCELIRVKDMTFNGNCCCGCCGVITLLTSDTTTPTLLIKGVPNGKQVYERLRNAVDKATRGARIEIQS